MIQQHSQPAPAIEFLPGTTTPAPRLMTAEEACRYLRLDDGRGIEAAVKALTRIVDRNLIRPCLVGRHRRYSRRELDRYIDAATEQHRELA